MPQLPPFTLTGAQAYPGNAVSFQVTFANAGDADAVQAYEWYLDGFLCIDAVTNTFAFDASCGSHNIGVRLLGENGWTGTQENTFTTCKPVTSITLNGPDTLLIYGDATYTVIYTFTDGSTADLTSLFTFTTGTGGAFNKNVFTATGDNSINTSYSVTISAHGSGLTLSKEITVSQPDAAKAGLLVVDLYNNMTLTVAGLIDNTEVSENHILAHLGANFVPTDSSVSNALILASDLIDQSPLKWRFIFNLARLKLLYPDITSFVFYIKGCDDDSGPVNGQYNRKNMYTNMVMEIVENVHLPTTSGGAQLTDGDPTFTGHYQLGAAGDYTETNLSTITIFTYSTVDESVTLTNT